MGVQYQYCRHSRLGSTVTPSHHMGWIYLPLKVVPLPPLNGILLFKNKNLQNIQDNRYSPVVQYTSLPPSHPTKLRTSVMLSLMVWAVCGLLEIVEIERLSISIKTQLISNKKLCLVWLNIIYSGATGIALFLSSLSGK